MTGLSRPLPVHLFDQPRDLATVEKLRWITIAWLFGSAWMYIVTGATMNQYAQAIGTPDWGFGILAALPFVGALFRLMGSYLIETYGHRRLIFLVGLTISRFMWVAAACLPWVFPELRTSESGRLALWPIMAMVLLVAWIGDAIGGTAWMNWMADVIPSRVRGRYFAVRHQASVPIALTVMVTVGLILDMAQQAEGESLLVITSVLLMIAGLLGVLDIQCFTRIGDDEPARPKQRVPFLTKLKAPLRDRNFVRFLGFQFTLFLATGFIGQYVWLFVLKELGVKNMYANVMLLGVPLVITWFSSGFWGRMIDRLGWRPVVLISGGLFIAGPLGWFFTTKENPWLGYAFTSISPFAFPGVNLASMKVMMGRSGAARRTRSVVCEECGYDMRAQRGGDACPQCGSRQQVARREAADGSEGGSAFFAVHSIAFAAGGLLSGVMASVVAKQFASFGWSFESVGIHLTYHHVLFAISSALRVVALIWVLFIVEPGASPLPEAIRLTSFELWSNVRRSVTLSGRAVNRFRGWSGSGSGRRAA